MITLKTYICGLCGTESKHSTNHEGEIYTPCKNCGNDSLFCKGHEPSGIETKLTVYRFDISNSEEKKEYEALEKSLKNNGLKLFDCIDSTKYGYFELLEKKGKCYIDPSFVFDNQWNTNLGRIFDWYESIVPNKKLKIGYYLTLTPEHYKLREPKKYNVKTYYKGSLIGEDVFEGINTSEPSNQAYAKYVPGIESFDIWSYKNKIELVS